jgi:transposase
MAEDGGVAVIGSTRRIFADAEKRQIVEETYAPGASVSAISRRYDINANLIFKWRRRFEWHAQADGEPALLPVTIVAPKKRGRPRHILAPASAECIEIDLAAGHRLRIPKGADPALLECVLRSLCS